MNPADLLAHFDRMSEAPDAIARLRSFVRILAVRGKLIPQDNRDEPIVDVLKRMTPLPIPPRYSKRSPDLIVGDCGLSIGDPRTPVPAGWVRVPMIDVARLESGHTPSRNRPDWWGGDIKWMGLVDARIHDGRAIYETLQHTNDAGIANSASRVLPAGTVCFSRTASVGYVVIMGCPMATSQDFVNWVPSEAVQSSWLQLVLVAERGAVDRFSKGAVHQTVYFPAWLSMHIVLPPLAEQGRIVAKVDELMGLCDQLEAALLEREARRDRLAAASLHRLSNSDDESAAVRKHVRFHLESLPRLTTRPEQIKQLRETILSLAVRGKLVEQSTTDESALALLSRIAKQRAEWLGRGLPNASEARTQLRKQMEQRLPDGLPALPHGWAWATLMQCAALIVDCHNKTAPYVDTGVVLLRTTNVRDGRLNLKEPKFVTAETYGRWSARCEPSPGDILITREAPMGEVCIIPEGMKVCLGQRMMLVRLVPKAIDPSFMLLSLRDPRLMERVQDKPVGATVQHLRVGGVETLLVPVPPLAEQRRIVARVDELMALCDSLEDQLTLASITRSRLLEAVLHRSLQPPQSSAPGHGVVAVPHRDAPPPPKKRVGRRSSNIVSDVAK